MTEVRSEEPADREGRTEQEQAETSETTDRADRSHLDVEDGCGCAEVWEHLSEEREGATGEEPEAERPTAGTD